MLYIIPTSGLSTLFTIVFDSCSIYCVGIFSSLQSSIPSICSLVFSSFRKRFLVLNCAPLPGKYCSASSFCFAATLKLSCCSFSDIKYFYTFIQKRKENKELLFIINLHISILFILLLHIPSSL